MLKDYLKNPFKPMVVEMDSQDGHALLTSKEVSNLRHLNVLSQCREFMQHPWQVMFNHVHRETNKLSC